jgi:branched-chain amino acid transport system ATP-binding protein
MSALLQLEGVTRRYGALTAVNGVDLTVEAGARIGLIGPNGAGKSTLFGLMNGRIRCSGGRIRFGGRDVTRASEAIRTRMGIVQTFQHSTLFPSMTCRETVVLAHQRVDGVAGRLRHSHARAHTLLERADHELEIVGLGDRRDAIVGALSHGERRQLEVAVGLACRPQLLLLDEPTAGMSTAETHAFVELIRGLDPQLAILIVEHDIDVVFGLARDVTVLHLGAVLASGSAEQIRASAEVQEAYLGAAERAREGGGALGTGRPR